MQAHTVLGSRDLARVLEDQEITCLDIGARRGFVRDLLEIAPAVHARGFEPDVQECEKLNLEAAKGRHPWKSLEFLPIAVGQEATDRKLHLYRQRGCSSLLEANVELAERFGRGEYYLLDEVAHLDTIPLDSAAERYGFEDAAYLKIDIQGAELEVFRTGAELLSKAVLAIRTEVSFMPFYRGQPLFHEIDGLLRGYGFVPMIFIEMHHWRQTSRAKLPRLAPGSLPYSQGHLAHGDVFYMRDLRSLTELAGGDVSILLKAAFLALAYGFVDYAGEIFKVPALRSFVVSTYRIDVDRALSDVSRTLARRYRRERLDALGTDFKHLVRAAFLSR